MDFPRTNKIHQVDTSDQNDINAEFGINAELLEKAAKVVDWKFFIKLYFALFGILLVSIFSLIVIVKAALAIF